MTYNFKICSNRERCEYWVNDAGDHYHREDGPAYIYYYNNGNIKEENWWINGKYHRIDGPAIIKYYENGQIFKEEWFMSGHGHRENGPASIRYDENGNIKNNCWLINGRIHRTDGPAIVYYDEDGKIEIKEYWWNGHDLVDVVKKLFGCIPDELTKDQAVLLKLSLSREYFRSILYDT